MNSRLTVVLGSFVTNYPGLRGFLGVIHPDNEAVPLAADYDYEDVQKVCQQGRSKREPEAYYFSTLRV